MRLKEKFKNILFVYEIAREESKINRCEIISDEFAIEFAEWCLSSGVYHQLIRTQKINKELLEIYKKEIR